MYILRVVLETVGAIVVAGGGLALIVYRVFKHLAVKWLDSQFDARLQALKHQHNQEIEQLRFKIAALLDRTTKLHQKEFETLPDAWARLNDAFWQVRSAVAVIKEYPDIDKMSPEHQVEFIDGCRLQNWEKGQLKQTDKKTAYYQSRIKWHDLHEAQSKSCEAHVFLLKNGIFFSEELRKAFQEIDDMIWNAVVAHGFEVQHQGTQVQREQIGKLNQNGEKLLREVEAKVRERIWPKDKVGL